MSKIYSLLILIFILALFLRVFKIDLSPPSLTWDEAGVGYNAYTIANYGRDEDGKFLPLYFHSFGEDKQPVHIYITALFTKLIGLNEFSTRLPAAIFGAFNVLLIFFLAKILLKNEKIGLLAAFFLSISPQNIHFSRFNHEANFTLFFFMLGVMLFIKSLKKQYLLLFALVSFFLSMISYHAAEIVVPLTGLLLFILYFKQLQKKKGYLLAATILIMGFLLLALFQPRLFGINRFNQTFQGKSDIEQTPIFKSTNNYFLGRLNLVFTQYLSHFHPNYLFISGDKNPRLSAQKPGEFYILDIVFLFLGVFYLIKKKSKETLFLLFWGLIGPLPSSLFAEAPHAGRAAFMMGGWQLIAAAGAYYLINFSKKIFVKYCLILIIIISFSVLLGKYFSYYLNDFPRQYAIDWQYGMKQIVEYTRAHPEFTNVFVTDVRSQPYIFFLYYLKTPLTGYLRTVIFNNSSSTKSSNKILIFDKYYFGGNLREISPVRDYLYVLTPSEYDGLHYKNAFDIKQIINYPNETVAFYIISAK